jgi:uncharacterized membrane protein YecN with MAPEG domain
MLDRVAACCLLSVYFLWNTRGAFTTRFTPDDMMNLHGAFEQGFASLLKSCIMFFGSSYRPAGGLIYLSVFSIFGLQPLPFHVLCIGLLAANIGLLYILGTQLSGRREIGFLAALLSSFHVRMADLYYSAGTIYDLFATFCFLVCMVLYFRLRASYTRVPYVYGIVFLIIFIAGIGAKELAVIIPAGLATIEALWRPQNTRDYRIPALLTVAAAVFTFSRTGGRGPLAGNSTYAISPTPHHVLAVMAHNFDQLLMLPDETMRPYQVCLILFALVAIPMFFRSRIMGFGAVLFTCGGCSSGPDSSESAFCTLPSAAGSCLTCVCSLVRTSIQESSGQVCRSNDSRCSVDACLGAGAH